MRDEYRESQEHWEWRLGLTEVRFREWCADSGSDPEDAESSVRYEEEISGPNWHNETTFTEPGEVEQ